jgi:hypothetical protein
MKNQPEQGKPTRNSPSELQNSKNLQDLETPGRVGKREMVDGVYDKQLLPFLASHCIDSPTSGFLHFSGFTV